MKKLLTALLFAPLLAFASDAELHLDKAPVSTEPAALQNGAKLFVNYCLNCHGASYMRYNRLQQIGLSEQMIKDNLMFTADKVGEPMRIAMQRDEAVVKKINTMTGQRVVLIYAQHKFLPTQCFGETEYFVTDVRAVGEQPVSPAPVVLAPPLAPPAQPVPARP